MNKYDDVRLDVARLLAGQRKQCGASKSLASSAERLALVDRLKLRIFRKIVGELVDRRLWERLVYSNLALDWFDEFERYWVGELRLRPINPLDFHFLRGLYRQRFQSLVDVSDANALEEGWRDARSLYLLFHLAFRNALRPLAAREYLPWIRHGGAILEFGCGLAPIASSLARFYRDYNLQITCADIEHLLFHYVRWKFRNESCVRTVSIDPGDDEVLDDVHYDTILCMTVLEHVPRPVQTLKSLHARLNPGGYLIFDYIKSEARGLDSEGGLRDRIPALQFVLERFDIVAGEIHLDGRDVGRVVCRCKP